MLDYPLKWRVPFSEGSNSFLGVNFLTLLSFLILLNRPLYCCGLLKKLLNYVYIYYISCTVYDKCYM